ncbi:ABC transporter permease [Sinirhodobacter populi]|uniref:ABC transporter permease n=1 Tax=Paenirhodobacter populi TaxID=2306993 RepID=A0A443KFR2_9RHOB|nr:ABC transporter permease [Sinirhodobacter populi]RWR31588.1 ABC transporter permease [Sinirhodobacter populi]
MFRVKRRRGGLASAFSTLELIYHATVRNVRQAHGNAFIGLLKNIFQTVVLVGSFYLMMTLLGMQTVALRGDFILYIMTGIFLYMTHVKAVGAVFASEGPASAMMKHAPMTPAIAIASAALGTLYLQVLSAMTILFIYHAAFVQITIYNWVGAFAMLLLAWFSGVAVGVIFLALKPWAPDAAGIAMQIYTRVNMIASGKFFLANTLPHKILMMFSWNPLFHTIDQARGFTFINYNPHYSNWQYPLYVGLALMMIGLMGEFYTRQRASASWQARH